MGKSPHVQTRLSNSNSMKQKIQEKPKPDHGNGAKGFAIKNQLEEICCFFSLIAKHYQDILGKYAKLDEKESIVLGKTSYCTEMIVYCDEGLEHLKSDNGREVICILDKMIACFSTIIQHTGSSQTEIPNLKELRATRFYTSNLKKQITRAFENQES
ncbi:MAG TPA: hypothetical protein PLR60_03150 [Syntrophorhabdaceae bacterium]|nr:hypothetical protein [Syntrophorhabdaceae bacterium]